MQLAARLTAALALLFAVCAVFGAATASAESPGEIALTEGRNVVTWAGSEPYAIAHLQGTPVSQVHRWDPATQTWLSRFIGQDDATLPDRHLLPRVQYLLVADGAYELTIPAPLADVDPKAELRTSPPPQTPLRFDAVWPNEYSPLDDLVVLRGDDQFLSVKARVTGGVGEVSVLWMIDGRLNYEGLASDEVSLTPGGHDHGLVYAADESGQVAVAELPRVVRVRPSVLPEMVYGISAHIGWHHYEPYAVPGALEAAAESIADAGLTVVRGNISPGQLMSLDEDPDGNPLLSATRRRLEHFLSRGLDISAIYSGGSIELTSMDLDILNHDHRLRRQTLADPAWGTNPPWSTSAIDPLVAQLSARYVARYLPEIRYYEPLHEPNHTGYNAAIDPWASAAEIKAVALGLWYENPDVILLGPETGCTSASWYADHHDPIDAHGYGDTSCGEGVLSEAYLQAMYEAGFAAYHDVSAFTHHEATVENMILAVDRHREVMIRNGDRARPLWIGEIGWATPIGGTTYAQQAAYIVGQMDALRARADVTGQIIFVFQNQGEVDLASLEHTFGIVEQGFNNGQWKYKPAYWAIREYLTGQPPPSGE